MFSTLLEKELKSILLTPKFVATFGVCALLILLSAFIGIQDYHASVEQYETAIRLVEQGMREETNWWGVDNQAYREPNPMQIFVSGVNNDIGRLSDISTWNEVKLEQSTYSSDPLFAVFRFIDFTFIVQVVLSLFAILFTYNAINGERESGTLKLALSNAVPRAQYVLAKFVGSWIGLVVPLLIPILLMVLLVMLMGVPMEAIDWYKLATLIGASVLYFTFFIALGLLVSALTKRSAVSFLVLLVAWVVFVLIVPRAATMAAGQIVEVPSVAEIESQKDRFSNDRWDALRRERRQLWEERHVAMEGMTEAERETYEQQNRQRWIEEEDDLRQAAQEDIAEFSRKLNEDLRNQKARQEQLAFSLSRFSPSSSFQVAAMNLGGTNTTLKTRYEDAMKAYRTSFARFVEDKRREERLRNDRGRFSDDDEETIDLAEMPRFTPPAHTYAEAVAPSVVDVGLMALYTIAAFAGAFVSFLRYDVR